MMLTKTVTKIRTYLNKKSKLEPKLACILIKIDE